MWEKDCSDPDEKRIGYLVDAPQETHHSMKGVSMSSDKIEKKLPDEILDLIEAEALAKGINKQDAIANLISAVKETELGDEIKKLKKERESLEKQRDEDKKEIKFLREEVSKFSLGLTTLAGTIGEVKNSGEQSAILTLTDQINSLSTEISKLKESSSKEEMTVIEKNLPLIMVSVLAALLLIYLIASKVLA